MMSPLAGALLWAVRAFVYQHFAETTRPPSAAETAARFGVDEASAEALYAELHRRHAFLLDSETGLIRMANPFSGIPTDYRVHAGGQIYFANCAWDAFGVPAALGVPAQIEAACAQTSERIALSVPGVEQTEGAARIHFLVPFRHWYDDLVFT